MRAALIALGGPSFCCSTGTGRRRVWPHQKKTAHTETPTKKATKRENPNYPSVSVCLFLIRIVFTLFLFFVVFVLASRRVLFRLSLKQNKRSCAALPFVGVSVLPFFSWSLACSLCFRLVYCAAPAALFSVCFCFLLSFLSVLFIYVGLAGLLVGLYMACPFRLSFCLSLFLSPSACLCLFLFYNAYHTRTHSSTKSQRGHTRHRDNTHTNTLLLLLLLLPWLNHTRTHSHYFCCC